MNLKVLLINPPREHEIYANNPPVIEEERGYNPPLGLLYLAGYLEQFSDHSVSIIDSQVETLGYPELSNRVKLAGADVVGITTMTLTLIDVLRCVRLVKQLDSNIRVVLGGPHVHLFPQETIALDGVDFLVLGEGEIVFKQLLDNIDDFDKLSTVPGLVFQYKGKTVNTGIPPFNNDLDSLPYPARHLVPYQKYSSLLAKGNIVTTIFTSRGCPFHCSFCDRPHLGKNFRAHSAPRVVAEIEKCTRMGIKDFLFYDDTFTVNKKRTLEICDLIIKQKLDISFDIRSRVDTINEEMIKMLKKAGCRGIHYGVESGTEKILKVLEKNITLDRVKKVFDMTRKHKIPILAYFMIGNPTETRDDIETTFNVIKRLRPDFIHLTIFTPFPGTKIYLEGLNDGAIEKDYWREFALDPTSDFTPPHWDEHFSRKELENFLIQGYKKFYFRPVYILKRALKIRSFDEFKRNFSAALKVFSMK